MEVPYFIKSRDRTDEFLTPEVTVLPFSRSVLGVGDCRGRTAGLTMESTMGGRPRRQSGCKEIRSVTRNTSERAKANLFIT